jgi:4-hydroxybenzoate polyprenyltransferase
VAGFDHSFKAKRFRQAGQGVVEYAGALVIAAGIIAAGIIIVPPNFAGFISSVYNTMSTFIISQLPK